MNKKNYWAQLRERTQEAELRSFEGGQGKVLLVMMMMPRLFPLIHITSSLKFTKLERLTYAAAFSFRDSPLAMPLVFPSLLISLLSLLLRSPEALPDLIPDTLILVLRKLDDVLVHHVVNPAEHHRGDCILACKQRRGRCP